MEDFIKQQKRLYKALQPCFCLALQTTVHFNSEGFRHLLYSRNRPRNHREKIYRLALINHLTEVITRAPNATQKTHSSPSCIIWVLDWMEVEDQNKKKIKVKVILRKVGNGNVHFLSVMRKKKPNGPA
jgi:hypothetical protein